MNKLTKLSLIAAILTSGAMAATNDIPNVIKAGGTLIINKDTTDNTGTCCDVFGKVITELEESPFPTVSGCSFNVHKGSKITDITSEALLEANPVDGVEKIYDYKTYNGYFDDRINATVKEVNEGSDTLSSLTDKDLVLLAASEPNQQLELVNDGTYEMITCHFGDKGTTEGESYELVLNGNYEFDGNFDNFNNGKIIVKEDSTIVFTSTNFYVPVKNEGCMTFNAVELHSELTSMDCGQVIVSGGLSIENGGVYRIGTAD